MKIEYVVIATVVATVVYLLMGIGAAKAEKKAMGKDELSEITIILWPIALLTWGINTI